MSYTAEFGEGLVNEDEGDKDGEDLLGEAGDEAHQEAALYRYHQHDDDNEPHPDPHSTYDVLDVPRLTELAENVTHTQNVSFKKLSMMAFRSLLPYLNYA